MIQIQKEQKWHSCHFQNHLSNLLNVNQFSFNQILNLKGISNFNNDAIKSITRSEVYGFVTLGIVINDVMEMYSAIFTYCELRLIDDPFVICVSGKLSGRGTPFKDLKHIFPLTDIIYEASKDYHYEDIIQSIGRITSRDNVSNDRTLWVNLFSKKDCKKNMNLLIIII